MKSILFLFLFFGHLCTAQSKWSLGLNTDAFIELNKYDEHHIYQYFEEIKDASKISPYYSINAQYETSDYFIRLSSGLTHERTAITSTYTNSYYDDGAGFPHYFSTYSNTALALNETITFGTMALDFGHFITHPIGKFRLAVSAGIIFRTPIKYKLRRGQITYIHKTSGYNQDGQYKTYNEVYFDSQTDFWKNRITNDLNSFTSLKFGLHGKYKFNDRYTASCNLSYLRARREIALGVGINHYF